MIERFSSKTNTTEPHWQNLTEPFHLPPDYRGTVPPRTVDYESTTRNIGRIHDFLLNDN